MSEPLWNICGSRHCCSPQEVARSRSMACFTCQNLHIYPKQEQTVQQKRSKNFEEDWLIFCLLKSSIIRSEEKICMIRDTEGRGRKLHMSRTNRMVYCAHLATSDSNKPGKGSNTHPPSPHSWVQNILTDFHHWVHWGGWLIFITGFKFTLHLKKEKKKRKQKPHCNR